MKQFDLISDIHLNSWMNEYDDYVPHIESFVQSLLPKKISNVLVIAGDLGHDNEQNELFIKSIKKYYEYILIVHGNHDFYMSFNRELFKYDSINRWNDMKTKLSKIKNTYILEGNTVEIDNVTFGGTGMWYDCSYGLNILNSSLSDIMKLWSDHLSDSMFIEGLPSNILDMYQEENKKLKKVIDISDIIVTHVSPDWSIISEVYRNNLNNSFFYFDGREYFDKINNKIWCYGHTHEKKKYYKHGCLFVNNSLGYKRNLSPTPIINIAIN